MMYMMHAMIAHHRVHRLVVIAGVDRLHYFRPICYQTTNLNLILFVLFFF